MLRFLYTTIISGGACEEQGDTACNLHVYCLNILPTSGESLLILITFKSPTRAAGSFYLQAAYSWNP